MILQRKRALFSLNKFTIEKMTSSTGWTQVDDRALPLPLSPSREENIMAMTDAALLHEQQDAAIATAKYEFDAPRFFDFNSLLRPDLHGQENQTDSEVIIQPRSKSHADLKNSLVQGVESVNAFIEASKESSGLSLMPPANTADSLFTEENRWFETCKYKVQSPDGKSYYIPVKPVSIAADPLISQTPFGKLCLQNSESNPAINEEYVFDL